MNNTGLNAKEMMDFVKHFLQDSKNFFNFQDNNFIFESNHFDHAENVYTGASRQKEYVSPLQTFDAALVQLFKDEQLRDIQDFCFLYKLDSEMPGVGFKSPADYVRRLPDRLPADHKDAKLPNENNFKNIDWGSGIFPNWNWNAFAEKSIPHITSLCWAYIRFMASQGFYHPALMSSTTDF